MLQEKIFEFFKNKKKTDGLEYDTDLFEKGFVNSLFALEIVMWLEKEFKIKLKRADINQDNFKTINNMAALVERLTDGK